MLHYTFPIYALLAAGMAALPQHFISAGTMASSPLQPHLGSAILSSTRPTLQSTFTSTLTLTAQVNEPPTPTQAATTPPCSLQARRVPTTFTTLPNPTPSPTPASTSLDPREHTRFHDDTDDDDDDTGPLDPKPWPKWLGPATLALVFYDALTLCAFFWLWITGHFWWLRCFGPERGEEDMLLRDGVVRGGRLGRAREVGMEREMRRMGMV
jgi:hypothetical protein